MRNWHPRSTIASYQRMRRNGVFQASPPAVLAGGFLLLILAGTLLLSLPIAQRQPFSVFSAFFMATSAVTITGLTVLDVSQSLTHFGQIVLALLVQIGGLGFVTLAVVAALTLGRRISLKQQALVLEAFNQTSVTKVRRTAFAVFRISVTIQLAGALLLFLWWLHDKSWLTALYHALFYATIAFNNAGFSLNADNLMPYAGSPVILLTISSLIILGGIGFTVLSEVWQKRRWSHFSVYTRVIIIATLCLNLFGFIMIFLLESGNPGTLGPMSWDMRLLNAWMQAITTRTAGFNSVDTTQLTDSTALLMMALMFIGGGSLSTASGIKVGTFIVLLAAVRSYLLHREEIVLMKRSISPEVVQKSLALLLVTTFSAFMGIFLMTLLEDAPFLDLAFEVISALSTTGLSRDLTMNLSQPSQFLLTVLMFVGRIGPLTLIYSLATQRRSRVRYPESHFQVG
ncbi:TrkH family potassium uptake protein [Paracandidimonas soli]|uniref:TrkH family potassium uptake protein n=1 Tax=Paracandidimonas soli TaxID=1917182 RepID=UPI00333F5356